MSNVQRPVAFQKYRFAQTDSKYPQQCDDFPMYQPDAAQAPRRQRGKWSVLLVVVFAAVPLYYFGYGAYNLYNYRAGTPTTATDIHCRAHDAGNNGGGMFRALRPLECSGTWTINGQSLTGAIEGPREGYPIESSAEVRVNGDTAFTARGAAWRFVAGTLSACIIAFLLLLRLWVISARHRHREGTLPTQT
jgi:TRAP-type C4-dicarboxylate transport system permease small subunit